VHFQSRIRHARLFHRTRKGNGAAGLTGFTATPEAVIAGLLVASAVNSLCDKLLPLLRDRSVCWEFCSSGLPLLSA